MRSASGPLLATGTGSPPSRAVPRRWGDRAGDGTRCTISIIVLAIGRRGTSRGRWAMKAPSARSSWVGNLDEMEMATGTRDRRMPRRDFSLPGGGRHREAGPCPVRARHQGAHVPCEAIQLTVVCATRAGDASRRATRTGSLSGWDLGRTLAFATRPARSSHRAWRARRECRRPSRSTTSWRRHTPVKRYDAPDDGAGAHSFLSSQYVERDGEEGVDLPRGVAGSSGHRNVAGIGQALYKYRDRW